MKWSAVLGIALLTAGCGGNTGPEGPAAAADGQTPAGATAASATAASAPAPVPPPVREWSIPSGTTLRLDLGTALASDTSMVEEPVRATLRQAVVIDGETVIPAGAALSGVVTGVQRAGRVKGRAALSYRFDRLTVDGTTYPITSDPIGHQAEATKGEDAAKIGVGAGAGAVIGGILGGGDGAAKGAAIGGAAGTGTVLATRGREVRLAPGANVSTRLTAPLVIRRQG